MFTKNSMWSLILYPFIAIQACVSQPVRQDIVIQEKPAEDTIPVSGRNIVSCLVVSGDSIYCYRGANLSSGKYYSLSGSHRFRTYLQEVKKDAGNSLVIVLKPTARCSYKKTVAVLDEMGINKIEKYAMVQLNEAEESFLQTRSFDFTPPEPVAVQTPNSVITRALPENNAMLIVIDKDNRVSYHILMEGENNPLVKVSSPVTKNLAKAIADFQKRYEGKKITYLMKGNPNSTYPVFEKVIEALKQNNIYKYNLITSVN
jgi:biopolymer transport protein ExbD